MKIKKEIHHIHDKSYKDLFSNKEILINMVQSFVKSSWGKDITKDNIELVNKSYILSDYEELESDIVYKATIENKEVIFYILLEFQSYVDYSMPIRLFLYMTEIWREVLKNTKKVEVKSKDFKLPAIVPIVLYNGEYKWTVERKNTLSDEIKDKLGERIEDILIANKEEVAIMTSNISKTIKETFEKTREEGIQKGIEEGIEKGMEKGKKNKAIEIAKNLLDILDDETISIKTGLTIEEVKRLRD